MSSLLAEPKRDYAIIGAVFAALIFDYLTPAARPVLIWAALLGSLPTAWAGLKVFWQFKITIETFNLVALAISFGLGEYRSTAFIVLMLTFAAALEWRTASRTRNAVAEILALKPRTAWRERAGELEEVVAETLQENDILVIKPGNRVAADGIVVHGEIFINESSVTGESVPVKKEIGDRVLSGTLGDSGAAKVRVTRVGRESTLERMAALIAEAAKNKSRTQRLADRFAAIFLPIVLLLGAATYYFTRNASMTAAIFLVACADDMAVAIPLAVSAAIGSAAKRGVLIKGGEWLTALARVQTVVLDKTGTLTYGSFNLSSVTVEKSIEKKEFWELVGATEKYSEHPIGRAILKEAIREVHDIPEADQVETLKGTGVAAKVGKRRILIGDDGALEKLSKPQRALAEKALGKHRAQAETAAIVIIDKKFAGSFGIADQPRPEARASLIMLKQVGIQRIIMFTGDNPAVANAVGRAMGIREVFASMLPEDKLSKLKGLRGPVAMVGDGINDAPALAQADVGIAMGSGGTAVAVEAADIVILTDNLSRLPEMIRLSRRTVSVINWDMGIWAASNLVGFALVLTGFAGPALAAFYNFATDFLPMINSSRLFREEKN